MSQQSRPTMSMHTGLHKADAVFSGQCKRLRRRLVYIIIIIHLMCAPEGNSEFCFPESLKTHYFPREHILSALLYSKERKINNTYTIIVFSRYHDNKSKIL